MNKFVAQLVHDIKNPVGNSMMYNEMLYETLRDLQAQDGNEEISELIEFSGNIKAALNNLIELLDAWVICDQIMHEDYKGDEEPVAIDSEIEKAINDLKPYHERKNLNIVKNWNESNGGFTVYSDGNILPKVIRNMVLLLVNFADSNDDLQFTLSLSDGKLHVKMEDSYTHSRDFIYDRFTGNELWEEYEVPKEGVIKPAGYGLKFCGVALNYLNAEPKVEKSDLGGLSLSFSLPIG